MEEKGFVWTTELNKRLLKLRFENDWLFKKKKQPWGEFHKLLLENGFPEEMTVKHVRKKWSYMYDTYRIAKRTKNRNWKYYKIFEKHYGKANTLDKYESWNDEWRLKLITCINEAKALKIDMWRTVERAMRYQELPEDCCVQDMKGLWQHIRTTFNRKHRLKVKKGISKSDWPLYDMMLSYYKKYDPDYIRKLETEPACDFFSRQRKTKIKNKSIDNNDNENSEFNWSKDITETFIQIRLQNDKLFRERKWAWNDLAAIMVDQYGFPKTLSGREICRKWAATFSEYQKAKATNNRSWVYYTLFELYLDEGSLSLNPLVGWLESWVHSLINARIELEHLFKYQYKDQSSGWREVEKQLRGQGLPLEHSLLDLPDIWAHLLKTYKWKRKFANKGILNEQWPFYEAMTRYMQVFDSRALADKQEAEFDGLSDYDDDIKLFDLKQKLQLQVKPKDEAIDGNQCRCCYCVEGCVDLFQADDSGVQVAHKLRVICGLEVEKSDSFPSRICLNCLKELENAYKFRLTCQETDKQYRSYNAEQDIKVERDQNQDHGKTPEDQSDLDDHAPFDDDVPYDLSNDTKEKPGVKQERKIRAKRKKPRKLRYDYWKICEICGKNTRNLISHLDMHSKGKSYSCDVCDKKFKFKSGLIIHKAVHDPTPKKTCEVCGKTFHVVAQYRRHFVYHANERKYGCETCGKRFNTLDILRVHNRTHTDERPFSCQECGKKFRTAGCVSRHKRIVHKTVKE